MMMSQDSVEVLPQYNSQTIIDAANSKLQSDGINSAQTVFQSALLDWVDDVTMGDMGDNVAVKGEIVKLWLAYANLNRSANLVSFLVWYLGLLVVLIVLWYELLFFRCV